MNFVVFVFFAFVAKEIMADPQLKTSIILQQGILAESENFVTSVPQQQQLLGNTDVEVYGASLGHRNSDMRSLLGDVSSGIQTLKYIIRASTNTVLQKISTNNIIMNYKDDLRPEILYNVPDKNLTNIFNALVEMNNATDNFKNDVLQCERELVVLMFPRTFQNLVEQIRQLIPYAPESRQAFINKISEVKTYIINPILEAVVTSYHGKHLQECIFIAYDKCLRARQKGHTVIFTATGSIPRH
ncbi:uncharacterized protein LOC116351034 [Contarinia nasturtii]|uniref:uncharacterized protein LOC116351034 n=1 Tax=Contarinia nasturtii TaxID=265458 RepID=UPI0012D3AB83|nr:uncharacterized protein LOC116351034 [Contarinia nasturtii]